MIAARKLKDTCSLEGKVWQTYVNVKLLQSGPTVCDPVDCSPPGSSIHGEVWIEYWSGLPCPSSIGSCSPKDCTHDSCRSCILGRFCNAELPGKLLDSILKSKRHHFADKGRYSQSYGFFSSRVWKWELVYKKGLALKNWCFQTVVLEKPLESPLDCEDIKQINSKGYQPRIFFGMTDPE